MLFALVWLHNFLWGGGWLDPPPLGFSEAVGELHSSCLPFFREEFASLLPHFGEIDFLLSVLPDFGRSALRTHATPFVEESALPPPSFWGAEGVPCSPPPPSLLASLATGSSTLAFHCTPPSPHPTLLACLLLWGWIFGKPSA